MDGITLTRADAVAVITIDRPKANAIDARTSRALHEAVQALEFDASLRVGIITGAGSRFFSAGWDLKAAAAGEAADADFGPGGFAGITEMRWRRKPLIAAVNGLAFGGGFELALACDLIIAAEHAVFALPEASLGIMADAGGVLRLPRIVGRVRAAEMLMTGRRLDASTALRWGLLNSVVADDRLMEEAMAMAGNICANAPLSIAAVLEVWEATDALPLAEALQAMHTPDMPIHAALASSADAREGVLAFTEKRTPHWTGS